MKKRTEELVTLAFLVGLQIVLSRILRIETPITRISFSFVPIAVMGALYGPWITMGTQAVTDVVGFFLFPSPGAYFPGFTLTSALVGFVYGFFLKDKATPVRIISANIITSLGLNLILNTYWLTMMTTQGFGALLKIRLLPNLLVLGVKTAVLLILLPLVLQHVKKRRKS